MHPVSSTGSLTQAIERCHRGGRVVLYGLRDEFAPIPLRDVVIRTITISGSGARPDPWPRAISVLDTAEVSLVMIISRRARIWVIHELIADKGGRASRELKIVLTP